jgi:excisionase family DNA binding protein
MPAVAVDRPGRTEREVEVKDSNQDLLQRRQAALRLGISVDSVDRLIRNGELGVVRIGRSVLVPQADVVDLIERRRLFPKGVRGGRKDT